MIAEVCTCFVNACYNPQKRSRNQTCQWKIHHLQMIFPLLKRSIYGDFYRQRSPAYKPLTSGTISDIRHCWFAIINHQCLWYLRETGNGTAPKTFFTIIYYYCHTHIYIYKYIYIYIYIHIYIHIYIYPTIFNWILITWLVTSYEIPTTVSIVSGSRWGLQASSPK